MQKISVTKVLISLNALLGLFVSRFQILVMNSNLLLAELYQCLFKKNACIFNLTFISMYSNCQRERMFIEIYTYIYILLMRVYRFIYKIYNWYVITLYIKTVYIGSCSFVHVYIYKVVLHYSKPNILDRSFYIIYVHYGYLPKKWCIICGRILIHLYNYRCVLHFILKIQISCTYCFFYLRFKFPVLMCSHSIIDFKLNPYTILLLPMRRINTFIFSLKLTQVFLLEISLYTTLLANFEKKKKIPY